MALEEFTSGGARDFRQRYLGVYGYYPLPSGEKILVYLSTITERETKFVDAAGVEYTAKVDQGVFFQFVPIEKRLFTMDNTLILAERRPARQYSRGMSDNNTAFLDVGYSDPINVNARSITAYTNPVYVTKLNADAAVQLLSPMFGIRYHLVYLYNRDIGVIIYNKDKPPTIKVRDDMFYQELVDVVRERKIEVEVVRA